MKEQPRGPTTEEWDGIRLACIDYYGEADCLDGARVCIIADYMSDGPGYWGPVAIVVWPGGPELTTVLTKKRDAWRVLAETREEVQR